MKRTPPIPSATKHECPQFPNTGVSLSFAHSKLLRESPAWHLEIQREATESDLEENHHLEAVGDTIWSTVLEVSHCPYCGHRLPMPPGERPADLGRFTHIDASGWLSRRV